MAKPETTLPLRSPQGEVQILYHRVTFGASSAVSSESSNSGVSVVKTATGRWTATIEAPARELLWIGFDYGVQGTVNEDDWQVYTDFSATTRTVVFSNAAAGSETDPTSGEKLRLCLHVKVTDSGFSL